MVAQIVLSPMDLKKGRVYDKLSLTSGAAVLTPFQATAFQGEMLRVPRCGFPYSKPETKE
jgi:hypothetical protein